MSKPKFEIRKFKSQRGHEGPGFACELYVDGVRGADVVDQGDGGMIYWHWFDAEAKKKWDEHVAAQPEEECGLEFGLPSTMEKPDQDTVMARLVDEFEARRAYTRKCKTKTLFRLKSDKPDTYHEVKLAFTPRVADRLRQQYGDDLLEIINETLARD